MFGVLVFAFWSDYVRERSRFILAGFIIASIGFIGQLAIPHTRLEGVTYLFLFPIAIGLYSPYVCIVCLVANNLAPSSKRAVGMALLVTVGNLGGICGSNIFLSKQAPKYPVGFGVCLGVLVCSMAATVVMRYCLKRENQRRDDLMAGRSLEEVRLEYTEEELLNLGDRSPFFRYTL
jgi:MFS family permease